MPLLKFLGFPAGSTASLSATQGADTASVTVADWESPARNVALSIVTRRSDVPEARHAPEGIFFEAVPLGFEFADWGETAYYEPAFHEIDYEWDFGDPHSTWTAPRLPAEFNDPSRGFGQKVGHVFTAPGTYVVRCTARKIRSLDPLEFDEATATTSVTVGDPDEVFSPEETVVCDFTSPTPDFTGAPEGIRVTDPADLIFVMDNTAERAGKIRVRFKVGDNRRVFNEGGGEITFGIGYRPQPSLVRYDSWGGPGKVILSNMGVNQHTPHGRSRIVVGYHIKGFYDVETTLGDETSPSFGVGRGIPEWSSGYRVYHDMEFSNDGTALFMRNRSVAETGQLINYMVFVNNAYMHDLRDYGILCDDAPGDLWSITGVACIDAERQVQQPLIPGTKFHSGIRTSRAGHWYLDGCDMFSRKGWSGGGFWKDGVPAVFEQPCLRLGSSYSDLGIIENVDDPGSAFITRCVFEGGARIGTHNAFNPSEGVAIGNVVYDGNILVGSPKSAEFVNADIGGLTVRANLLIKPATGEDRIFAGVNTSAVDGPPTPAVEVAKDPVKVYGNTFVVLYDPAEIGGGETFPIAIDGRRSDVPFEDFVQTNNAVLGANLSPAQDALLDYPADTTTLFPPRWTGRRMPVSDPTGDGLVPGPMEPEFATPTDSIAWYAPTDFSVLPGASDAVAVPVRDVRRRVLSATPVVGAHQREGD